MDSNPETKESSLTMASKEEGSVLNADDLKLAEMGYKPVSTITRGLLTLGTFTRVLDDVGYGIGV
jgi:hypothetical protein